MNTERKYSVEKTTTQMLRCLLTQGEKLSRSGELADNLKQLQDFENELTDFKNQMKAKTAAAEARVGELAEIVRSGYEFRKVDCVKTENYETAYVTVVRTDTGEVIENRPMNAEERQRKLNLFPDAEDHTPPLPPDRPPLSVVEGEGDGGEYPEEEAEEGEEVSE